jgi:hypothetical protein
MFFIIVRECGREEMHGSDVKRSENLQIANGE